MKKILSILILLITMSCMAQPPLYKTEYGVECSKKCMYTSYSYGNSRSTYTYGITKSTNKQLKECYELCKEKEKRRLETYRRIENEKGTVCGDK